MPWLIARSPIATRRGRPGREEGKPRIPKKETRSGARGELAMLRSKIEHCQPNSHPFRAAFSGIDCGLCPAWGGTFSIFISQISVGTCSEWTNRKVVM